MTLLRLEVHFLGGNYFQGLNGPLGKMADIKATISSIIASEYTLYLFQKLALKWGFHEKHFNVIIFNLFL